jgi:hypothetical protein
MTQTEQLEFFSPHPVKTQQRRRRDARSGSFVDNMSLPVHRWFRYSAGFSGEWVHQVIADFKADRKRPILVLDPFAGAGTTIVAANLAGVPSIGIEPHQLVARVARSKVTSGVSGQKIRAAARNLAIRAGKRATARARSRSQDASEVPDLLQKCFTSESLRSLMSLRSAWEETDFASETEKELIWLAITSILRICSHVGTAQWQYVLPNKSKAKTAEPLLAFQGKAAEIADDIDSCFALYKQQGEIREGDARDAGMYTSTKFDLAITSPPYPNNYDYADATRLEMTFWGQVESWGDLHRVVRSKLIRSCSQHTSADKSELAALLAATEVDAIRDELTCVCTELAQVRETKGGRKSYHTMVAAYFVDLAKVVGNLAANRADGARACFVVGDSAPYGVYVPAERWLGELALASGFSQWRFEKLRDRNVKWKNRKHRVPLHEGRLWIE